MRFLPAIAASVLLACACDGSSEPLHDARWPIDAAVLPPGDARLGVDCQGALCAPEESCCRTIAEPPQFVNFCVPAAELCDEIVYECDGPEDCESETCCAPGDDHVRCVDAGTCELYVACHADEDCGLGGRCCDTAPGIIRVCLGTCPE